MSYTVRSATKLLSGLAFALVGLVLTSGCDGTANPPPTKIVSGTVSLDGKPLTWGTVEFHGPEKQVRKAQIQTNGTYSIRNPELGEMRVVVRAGIPPKMAAGGGAATNKPEKI